jgi:amidase
MDDTASALDTAAAIRSREVSPLEVLEATLARIDERNPDLNAVIWRNDDEARAVARALGERIAAGAEDLPPFAGVPLPVKDLTAVAGQPLTHGSHGAPDGPAGESELVVDAFVAAGFVLTGRTNSPEFGSVTVTENLRFGATRNPWDTGHTPGGSSGGAAATVASGMVPVAHANDGGGSIRIPASCCGLVGLKPSRGRVPTWVAGWSGLTVEGVVTRTVADTAAVLDVISGPDPHAWYNAPVPARPYLQEVGADPGRLRIGLVTSSALGLTVDPACLTAVAEAGRLLESLGHEVVELDGDLFDPSGLGAFLTVMNSGLGETPGIDVDRIEPHNCASYEAGRAADSLSLAGAVVELQLLTRRVVARFGTEFDLAVTPTMAIEPPPVGLLARAHAEPELPPAEVLAMAAFTAAYNITGQPAISLPLHVADSGLPVGVQVVGGPWREDRLLQVASQLEAAAPWSGRYPFVR